MNIVHIDELELIPVGDRGLQWRPIRMRFGIRAFGTNAYTAVSATRSWRSTRRAASGTRRCTS